MIRKTILAAALATATVAAATAAQPVRADVYTIDKGHSEVSFQVRHLVTQVRGRFNDYQGTISLDPANMEKSSVDFSIKADSIDTDLADRDKHLRSPDFFDTAKFPEITFKSKGIKKSGNDTYAVLGTLTMRGVSKDVTLPVIFLGTVKDPWGNERAGFSTDLTLNRKDYGINWNATLDNGGVMLSDDVKISINLETLKKKEAAK